MSSERERPAGEAGQSQAGHEEPGADQSEEIWHMDVGSPEFAAEARRQSLLIANSPFAKEDMAFIESLWDELLAALDAEDERAEAESTGPAADTE